MTAATSSAGFIRTPTNPAWYHNLRAHPLVTVEVGPERFAARASITTEAERRRLYDQHAAVLPVIRDYERKTTRVIPVISLERIVESSSAA